MQFEKIRAVCANFDIDAGAVSAIPFGNGIINSTFLVTMDNGLRCVLQNVNTNVFKNPDKLMDNIMGVTDFASQKLKARGEDAERGTLSFFMTKDGKNIIETLTVWLGVCISVSKMLRCMIPWKKKVFCTKRHMLSEDFNSFWVNILPIRFTKLFPIFITIP